MGDDPGLEPGLEPGPDPEVLPREGVIAGFEADGYTTRFEVTDGARVRCSACARDVEPESFRIDRTGRYEGHSNPSDEELLLAVTSTACGHRGTLTLAYGPAADAAEAEVVRRLPDARSR